MFDDDFEMEGKQSEMFKIGRSEKGKIEIF